MSPDDIAPGGLSPDEKIAIRLADGQTFSAVYTSGGVFHGISPAADDLLEEYGVSSADEATVEERKEQVCQRLFSVAVYCIERGLAVEENLSKRRVKIPKEIRPSAEETARLVHLAKVFRARTMEDRKGDLLVGQDGTSGATRTLDGATLSGLYEMTRAGQIVILYPKMAEVIHREMHTLSFNDALYIYQDGFYSRDKGRISARIKEILNNIGYDGAFSVVRREVIGYLLAENPQDAYPFNKCASHLPVNNGVVRVDPGTGQIDLLPHDPKYRFSYKLPVTYNPAGDSTYIRQVLEQWVEPDDVPYLLQVPAVAILQTWGCVQKQIFLFEGKHDGGKTTYCEFLYGFFGDGGYSQVDLLRLSEDRFALADLEHKLANIHDEMRAVAVRSVGQVKNLTGGLHHRIERKHENAYHAVLPAVHLFTCNTPPKIKEVDDDAFWSRWVYVVFPNRFSRDDGWKAALFTEENYSAFLNLVLAVVVAVLQNRDALKRMTDVEVKERWTEAADATIKFVWAYFERDAEASVPKDDVFQAYLRHCQENGISARAKNVLSSDLARMGIAGTRLRGGKARTQAYAGIRWKGTSPFGQGGQGNFDLIACEKKEVLSTEGTGTFLCTNKVSEDPDHPDRDGSLLSSEDGIPPSVLTTINTYTWRGGLKNAGARCSVKGCDTPPEWVNKDGNWPLCSRHYNHLKQQATGPVEARP